MADWEAGAPSPAPLDAATAALIQRGATADRWELYIECKTPDPTGEAVDFVRLWLGPTGAPFLKMRIQSDGALISELPQPRIIGALPVKREADRWSVLLTIPEDAIEPTGVLRIALERIDPRNNRTTWPRPIFPWRAEPGRAAVDLSAWKELPRYED